MARYPYRILKNAFDRVFRNDLNKNFKDIEADIKSQKNRVDNLINEVEQPSEVVDARVDAEGNVYPVLKERLDTEHAELADHIQQNSDDLIDHENKSGNNDVHGLLSGGHIIEESGENENGHYVRFADGTQICFLSKSEPADTSTGEGALFKSANLDWIYPASFLSGTRPSVSGQVANASYAWIASGALINNNIFSFYILSPISRSTQTIWYTLLAIGRWK